MKAKPLVLIALFLLAVTSCIDEYWPDIRKYENLLVVDGTLTNEPGPYTVHLSLSSDVNLPVFTPYPGCDVIIYDNEGHAEQLTEPEPGTYVTSPGGIRGITGRMYKIEIHTPDGQSYESSYERLMAPVGIDTVYARVEYRETADLFHDLVGYQFYLNTHRAEQDSNYYIWQLQETYKFHSDFHIDYIYRGRIDPFTNRDTVYTCWKTENVHEIFTAQTIDLEEPVLTGFPLHYVDTETRRLQVRYSLLVRQFTITPEAFTFWDDLKGLIADEGSLFAKQPYQITGNVYNSKDQHEPVLGYFLVAGVDEKRYFFDKPAGVYFYYPYCILDTDLRGLFFSSSHSWPIYMSESPEGALGYASDQCFDCTLRDGTLEKPDFWID